MTKIWQRLREEPAMLYALAEVAIAAGLAFGADLTGEQVAAVLAVAAVLTGLGTRQVVTPAHRAGRGETP